MSKLPDASPQTPTSTPAPVFNAILQLLPRLDAGQRRELEARLKELDARPPADVTALIG